eukprot:GEMP01019167.1.p1 GENE.GEMP01019167.1~~GEMP01019167.1.p1  ORF type:complete len:651 (+),score=128.43 GEMP01019167.1:356-2308(+)
MAEAKSSLVLWASMSHNRCAFSADERPFSGTIGAGKQAGEVVPQLLLTAHAKQPGASKLGRTTVDSDQQAPASERAEDTATAKSARRFETQSSLSKKVDRSSVNKPAHPAKTSSSMIKKAMETRSSMLKKARQNPLTARMNSMETQSLMVNKTRENPVTTDVKPMETQSAMVKEPPQNTAAVLVNPMETRSLMQETDVSALSPLKDPTKRPTHIAGAKREPPPSSRPHHQPQWQPLQQPQLQQLLIPRQGIRQLPMSNCMFSVEMHRRIPIQNSAVLQSPPISNRPVLRSMSSLTRPVETQRQVRISSISERSPLLKLRCPFAMHQQKSQQPWQRAQEQPQQSQQLHAPPIFNVPGRHEMQYSPDIRSAREVPLSPGMSVSTTAWAPLPNPKLDGVQSTPAESTDLDLGAPSSDAPTLNAKPVSSVATRDSRSSAVEIQNKSYSPKQGRGSRLQPSNNRVFERLYSLATRSKRKPSKELPMNGAEDRFSRRTALGTMRLSLATMPASKAKNGMYPQGPGPVYREEFSTSEVAVQTDLKENAANAVATPEKVYAHREDDVFPNYDDSLSSSLPPPWFSPQLLSKVPLPFDVGSTRFFSPPTTPTLKHRNVVDNQDDDVFQDPSVAGITRRRYRLNWLLLGEEHIKSSPKSK